jgi:tetratricopeptide (TPR) repeat protein
MRIQVWILAASLTATWLFPTTAARAGEADDAKLFDKVMQRLLSTDQVHRRYPAKYAWPPKYFVKPESAKEVNAYASAHKSHGAVVDERSGKVRPVVMVTEGMLARIIEGDENSLAVIMGHELAHLSKDHVGGRTGETALLLLAFSRDQEIEADVEGLRFAIAAGYPYKVGVSKAIQAMRKRTKISSFEGLHSSHPSWEDRLVFLDREQAQLWSAMSAFQNGFLFLELEQYVSARQCFRAVLNEFPDCHEAWANLGYAQLMQYCDGLDPEDLRRLGIGQIVAGAFYTRPASLESAVRGINEKLWNDAVKSLHRALEIKSDLCLPRASLGLAYLVHPEGTKAKEASKWFGEALVAMKTDPGMAKNPVARAAVLVNAGVADLARDDTGSTEQKFKQAFELVGLESKALVVPLEDAIIYNQSLFLSTSPEKEKRQRAFKLLELYLARSSPGSNWWPLAFDRYRKLAEDLGLSARDRDDLAARKGPAAMRLVSSVAVGSDAVALSEPMSAAVKTLGGDAGVPVPLFPGSKVLRWHFAERGIDVLGKDRVLAIYLRTDKAPPVEIKQAGLATKARQLRVGMTQDEAMEVLKGQPADWSRRSIDEPGVQYVSYPELGLAVRYLRQTVYEIAIAQVPRGSFKEE